MTMPRLSLYRPEKGNDYKFIDKNIWEMFQIGGTDVFIHRYLGPGASAGTASPSLPVYNTSDPTQIQDLLFLENRDRKYDPDIYVMRGVYSLQDLDFNLSQFGLFLQNDTVFITFHINDTIEKLGRKLISGDVIELPHLKDDHALNDFQFALKRFYVIEEVNRAAEGFSVTWYPHLYRAKCKPLVDSQEFKEILDQVANKDAMVGTYNSTVTYYPGDVVTGLDGKNYTVLQEVTGVAPPNAAYYELADSLRNIMSTYEKEMQITQAVLDQAEADAPRSGLDTTQFYTLTVDENKLSVLISADTGQMDASLETQATDEAGNLLYNTDGTPIYVGVTAASVLLSSEVSAYNGYLAGDGVPPNGAPFTAGIAFPVAAGIGEFCLRKDYFPYRLFRYNGSRWVKVEDQVRMTMSNLGPSDVGVGDEFEGKDVRRTQKAGFINNTNTATIDGHTVKERQSLSKALRPEADE
jgi:hypothetical protein